MLEKREIETLYIFFRFFFSKYKYIDISSIDFHMEKSVANQIIGNFSAWKINDENKSGENKENILLRKRKKKIDQRQVILFSNVMDSFPLSFPDYIIFLALGLGTNPNCLVSWYKK